jgi:hypothetical protein
MTNEHGDAGKVDNLDPVTLTIEEWERAVAKFPTWPTDPFHALGVLGEECGELTKAVVQFTYEPHKGVTLADIREEAVQTAAMALRWIGSIDRYNFTRGPQHYQPMPAKAASEVEHG